MKGSPFFSIVIPVYNAMPYLIQMVESILGQTFQDWELILIDDCSTDNCKVYLEQLKRYPNVQIVSQSSNAGASAARNKGLDLASGRYITFWDADDEVDTALLEKAYHVLKDKETYLLVFGVREFYINSQGTIQKQMEIVPPSVQTDQPGEVYRTLIQLEQLTLYGYLWNKFYLTDYLKKINLRHIHMPLLEDFKFNVQYCNNITNIAVLAEPLYFYKKRNNNSLTNRFVPEYFLIHKGKVNDLYRQFENWGVLDNDTLGMIGNLYVRYFYSALERNFHKESCLSPTEQYDWCKSELHEDLLEKVIPYTLKNNSLLKKILAFPVYKKNCILCLVISKIIFYVKRYMDKLFVVLKSS